MYQRKEKHNIKYLSFDQVQSHLFIDHIGVVCKIPSNVAHILNIATKLGDESSIRCISIGVIKLSDYHIEFLKFWFVEPFGQFDYHLH